MLSFALTVVFTLLIVVGISLFTLLSKMVSNVVVSGIGLVLLLITTYFILGTTDEEFDSINDEEE